MAITSLFGPSPAEIILAQQKETQQEQLLRNQMIAQQGAEFGPFRGLYQAGLRLGDVGAQAMRQSLFPQQADPRLQKATDIQSILSDYADKDLNDPAVLKDISGKLRKQGYLAESFGLANQAFAIETKLEELGIKRATAGREARAEERTLLDFYKKNPEQTGAILQTLARQIEQDPTNAALLDRYNKIAQAGTSGAIEETAKAAKEALTIESIETTIKKNKKDLEKLDFDAGMRWNAEREAALALFKANGLDPAQPLKGSALINTELVNAQKIALRDPFTGAAPAVTPKPTAAPAANASIKSAVEAAGQKYEPNKYEYRIGPTGQVERKLK